MGAPKGNTNALKHGLSMIEHKRNLQRIPRGRDKRFKLELLNSLIVDAGGESITATKRLLAELIATDAVWIGQMDKAIQRILRLMPKYRENPAAMAKLDQYKRPIVNSLSANLERFGYDKVQPPAKTLEEILNEDQETETPEVSSEVS
jgi:hypothetical protein